MSFLRKSEPVTKADVCEGGLLSDEFSARFPALFEHLCSGAWPDGSPRERSTLLLSFSEDRFRACINDKARLKSAWVSNTSLGALLDALERGLQGDSLEWRRNTWNGRKK